MSRFPAVAPKCAHCGVSDWLVSVTETDGRKLHVECMRLEQALNPSKALTRSKLSNAHELALSIEQKRRAADHSISWEKLNYSEQRARVEIWKLEGQQSLARKAARLEEEAKPKKASDEKQGGNPYAEIARMHIKQELDPLSAYPIRWSEPEPEFGHDRQSDLKKQLAEKEQAQRRLDDAARLRSSASDLKRAQQWATIERTVIRSRGGELSDKQSRAMAVAKQDHLEGWELAGPKHCCAYTARPVWHQVDHSPSKKYVNDHGGPDYGGRKVMALCCATANAALADYGSQCLMQRAMRLLHPLHMPKFKNFGTSVQQTLYEPVYALYTSNGDICQCSPCKAARSPQERWQTLWDDPRTYMPVVRSRS